MNITKNQFFEKLAPYKGIIYFIIILFTAHFFWKFTMKGDESNIMVSFFGLDVTAPFDFMVKHYTKITYNILHLFNSDVIQTNSNSIFHPNGHGVHIVWGCTAIKQAYIFFCIIAFTRGSWKNKLWYIPMGLLVIYLFNLIRLISIIMVVKNHIDMFDLVHEHIFKYLFYGVIFLMWVIWDEKFGTKKSITKETENNLS